MVSRIKRAGCIILALLMLLQVFGMPRSFAQQPMRTSRVNTEPEPIERLPFEVTCKVLDDENLLVAQLRTREQPSENGWILVGHAFRFLNQDHQPAKSWEKVILPKGFVQDISFQPGNPAYDRVWESAKKVALANNSYDQFQFQMIKILPDPDIDKPGHLDRNGQEQILEILIKVSDDIEKEAFLKQPDAHLFVLPGDLARPKEDLSSEIDGMRSASEEPDVVHPTAETLTIDPLKKQNKSEPKGEFTLHKKADHKGLVPLKGAEFTLSKLAQVNRNPLDLPETFQTRTITVQSEDGTVKVDNLDPGVYELKETKAPPGYLLKREVYVVVVKMSGSTVIIPENRYSPDNEPVDDTVVDPNDPTPIPPTRTDPKSLDGLITINKMDLYNPDNSYNDMHPHKSEFIHWDISITLPADAIPGDTFTVDLDDKLDLNGLNLEKEEVPAIRSVYGEVIAEPEDFNSETNSFIYRLTDYVRTHKKITINQTFPFNVDFNRITQSGTYRFTNNIAGRSYSKSFNIKYESPEDYNKFSEFLGYSVTNNGWQYFPAQVHHYISGIIYPDTVNNKVEIYYFLFGRSYTEENNVVFDLENKVRDKNGREDRGSVTFDPANTTVQVYRADGALRGRPEYYPWIDTNVIIPSKGNQVSIQAKQPVQLPYSFYPDRSGIQFRLGNRWGDYGYVIKVTTSYNPFSPLPILTNGTITNHYWMGGTWYSAWNNVLTNTVFRNDNSSADGVHTIDLKLTKKEMVKGVKSDKLIPGTGFKLEKRGETLYRKTGDNGTLIFNGLTEGFYYLTEEFTPSGYNHPIKTWLIQIMKNLEGKLEVKLHENDSLIALSQGELIVYNEKMPPKSADVEILNEPNFVQFKKTDESRNPLANVSFQLKAKEAGRDGKVITTQKSDEFGVFKFEKIAPGQYEVWEPTAPDGYTTPNTPVATFDVLEDGTVTNIKIDGKVPNNIDGNRIVNHKHVKIDFLKVRANDGVSITDDFAPTDQNTSPLDGAIFALQKLTLDQDNKPIYETLQTTATTDGKFSFDGLETGAYKVIETIAPTGYIKEDAVATFNVDAFGSIKNLIIQGRTVASTVDQPTPGGPEETPPEPIPAKPGPYRILNVAESTIKLVKKDADGKTLLPGATFELYRLKKEDVSVVPVAPPATLANGTDPARTTVPNPNAAGFDLNRLEKYAKQKVDGKESVEWVESTKADPTTRFETSAFAGEKGEINFTGLSDGIYWLKETAAPSGYLRLGQFLGPMEIKHGQLVVPKEQIGPLTLSNENPGDAVATVTNKKAVYPQTGGKGPLAYALIGTMLLGASLWVARRKRKPTR